MAYQMAPTPMTLSHFEGHFCSLKPFWLTYIPQKL